MPKDAGRRTWNGTFTMAVGGGIFLVLGVVIGLAGAWAWLSLLLVGVVALLAASSYVRLSTTWGRGGGALRLSARAQPRRPPPAPWRGCCSSVTC